MIKIILKILGYFVLVFLIIYFMFVWDWNSASKTNIEEASTERETNKQVLEKDKILEVQSEEKENQKLGCQYFFITRVIDGNTVEIKNKNTFKLIGVDTADLKSLSKKVQFEALESQIALKDMIYEKKVCIARHESDKLKIDKFTGETFAYIWYKDKFINKEMIEQGYAKAFAEDYSIYFSDFEKAEETAKNKKKGILWNETKKNQFLLLEKKRKEFLRECDNSRIICSDNARNFINSRQTIRLIVKNTNDIGSKIFLDSEENFRKYNNFTIVIDDIYRDQFHKYFCDKI